MKSRIPKFQSLKEEREFWQTHSAIEFADELTPVKLEFALPRKRAVSVKLSGFEVRTLQNILTRLTRSHTTPHLPPYRKG